MKGLKNTIFAILVFFFSSSILIYISILTYIALSIYKSIIVDNFYLGAH